MEDDSNTEPETTGTLARTGSPVDDDSIPRLRDACRRGDVTLYLGAGVSVGNGLPTWEQLVLAMYYTAHSREKMSGWRPFPNYLFAIAEWHLKQSDEPLEITARNVAADVIGVPGTCPGTASVPHVLPCPGPQCSTNHPKVPGDFGEHRRRPKDEGNVRV